MWTTINAFLKTVDNFVWGVPLMVLILCGGILLTVRLGVLQMRRLPLALKWMIKNEDEESELLKTFSPALRDQSLINGLNRILMFFEDASGVARGTFSDPCQTARTATEIRSMRQRTFTTVAGIQKQLAAALRELSAAADALCTLYRLCPADGVTVTADFGDSVLTDTDADRKRDLEEVSCGVLSAEEYRAKWLGTCRSPGGTVIFDRKADIRI